MSGARPPAGHGYAFCCETCDSSDPHWRIMREGDAAVTWACDSHLASACDRLQRDYEVTRLIVADARKAREWAEITRTLREVAAGE